MKKAELLFIPYLVTSHIGMAVELAKLLVRHDDRFSVTFLVFKSPLEPDFSVESLSASIASYRIRLIEIPSEYHDDTNGKLLVNVTASVMERQKRRVREVVSKLYSSESCCGFILDMFATPTIEIAKELSIPFYFFTLTNATSLSFITHIQAIHEENKVHISDRGSILEIPTFKNPLHVKLLTPSYLGEESLAFFSDGMKKYREAKGIIINTFTELEPHAFNSLSWVNPKLPPVYPVGPMVSFKEDVVSGGFKDIMQWLDDQPPRSVVFVGFGSLGCFSVDQVKEIANALELSGHCFLWSLRRPPPKNRLELPSDYTNPREVLPEGFLKRTADKGKIIGWAPQMAILGHPAVGGFVCHCGWNSVLESIWFGVPIGAWPMHADNHLNAVQLVIELGLAVEVKMEHQKEVNMEAESIVGADEIERGIRYLMELDIEKRKKLKELSETSRKKLIEGGSSYTWFRQLMRDLIDNAEMKQAMS